MLEGKLVASRRSYFLRVRAAFFTEADRSDFERLLAAALAWRESAAFDAALPGSRSALCSLPENVLETALYLNGPSSFDGLLLWLSQPLHFPICINGSTCRQWPR
jgi:hypothetical protein